MDDLRFWKLIILFVSLALISCEKEIEDTIDLNSFDEIYVLDLHGNSVKKEIALDGSKDENVFDIRQGVSIVFMIKYKKKI